MPGSRSGQLQHLCGRKNTLTATNPHSEPLSLHIYLFHKRWISLQHLSKILIEIDGSSPQSVLFITGTESNR